MISGRDKRADAGDEGRGSESRDLPSAGVAPFVGWFEVGLVGPDLGRGVRVALLACVRHL
jgi:hypothetical protein